MHIQRFNPFIWCAVWGYVIIMATLLSSIFLEYSTLGHMLVCIGVVEIWDTMADHFRFQGFSTAEELQRGNYAVALYFLARVVLAIGCMYIGQAAL